jgi:hypothetical protein
MDHHHGTQQCDQKRVFHELPPSDEFAIEKPLPGRLGVAADQEDLLNGARPCVQTLQARARWILDLEAGRRFPAADFDAARDDPADVRAVLDDLVEDLIEPTDATVLALDPAKLHWGGL